MGDGSPYCHRRALNIADVDKYNYCRASHAEANAIAQAARYGVAIKGATLYVTLQPCFVCLKLLATAQIKGIYFELAYGSDDAPRDEFWKDAVAAAGFEVFEHLSITPGALEFILPSLTGMTSKRRLTATAAAQEPHFVGAVESE
jgi:dCMP deaminase